MVYSLSRQRLEEYSSKIRRLLDETKYCLTIPNEEPYKDETLVKINKEWRKAVPKLIEAKKLINQVLNLVAVDALGN